MSGGCRFGDVGDIDEGLKKAAEIAVKDVLAVKDEEKVIIVTNPDRDVHMISKAVYDAVLQEGGCPTLIFQQMKTQLDFAEDAVIKAITSNPDIVISISKEKLGKDKKGLKEPYVDEAIGKEYNHIFDYLYYGKKMRSFWSPSVTMEMFRETVAIDYQELRENSERLKVILDEAAEVKVQSDLGTDITIGIKGRKGQKDDGDFREPGKGGNLPAGEVYISPQLGASNGVIYYDGSISSHDGEIIIKDPIKAVVKDGFVTEITGGGEAEKLLETITLGEKNAFKFAEEGKLLKEQAETYAKNARNLGELGIGLNKKAKIVGNMLEDEKVYGTCHIAIGSNYDEDAKALIHLDGLIKSPTLVAVYENGEEKVIMEKGSMAL